MLRGRRFSNIMKCGKRVGNGRYTLTQELGRGSFGTVYLAQPYAIKELCAMKMDGYLHMALQR